MERSDRFPFEKLMRKTVSLQWPCAPGQLARPGRGRGSWPHGRRADACRGRRAGGSGGEGAELVSGGSGPPRVREASGRTCFREAVAGRVRVRTERPVVHSGLPWDKGRRNADRGSGSSNRQHVPATGGNSRTLELGRILLNFEIRLPNLRRRRRADSKTSQTRSTG